MLSVTKMGGVATMGMLDIASIEILTLQFWMIRIPNKKWYLQI